MGDILLADRDLAVICLAGLATFCVVLVASWHVLLSDPLGPRMRTLTQSRHWVPDDTPANPTGERKRPLLTSEPKRFFAAIVERLNLARQMEDGATLRMLQMAGFRGRAPVITFLAMRVLMPLAMLGISVFYMFLVLRPDLHLLPRVAICIVCTGLGYYLPGLYVKNKTAKRQKSIGRSWPDALDLLLICVESGMSVEHAFRRVADEMVGQSRELAEELALTTAELSFLPDRRNAYENLGRRTGLDGIKSVVIGLMQSEQYGTALGHALRVLAQDNRNTRMGLADKKAAALSPKLTVPMILFFLPVLFAVIITPAAIQMMSN